MAVRYPSLALRKQTAKRRDAELKTPPAQDRVLESPLVYAENLLPSLPGRVHGIVSLDPAQVQCDRCGLIETAHEGEQFGPFVMRCGILFTPSLRGRDDRRLCADCREARWVA